MKEFVTGQVEKQHEQAFGRVVSLQEKRGIAPIHDPFKNEWQALLPEKQYGDVTLPSANAAFIASYKDALAKGKFEEFKENIPESDFSGIYRVRAVNPTNEKDKIAAANYSPESIDSLEKRLAEFLRKIEGSNIAPEYKAEYRKRIQNGEMQHLKMARNLGAVEYTIEQKIPSDWSNFVDLEKTLQQKTIVLPYEDLAQKLLEKSKKSKEHPVRTMKDALNFWELTDAEKQEVGYDNVTDDTKTLSNKQTVALLNIVLKRYKLFDWKSVADPAVTAINDSSREKEMQVPSDREFDSADAIFIPGHETVHSVSVENGQRQEFGLLWEGVFDYLKTEEGKASANELILGLSNIDSRQVKLYGRYMAVAMALKADVKDGKPQPRFSTQKIYDTLKDYGVRELDAKDIVWRIMRGTTLRHKGVMIPVDDGKRNIVEIPSAECFVKDALYFEGQRQVFEWLRARMPVKAGHRASVTTKTEDFSDKTLARVGLKAHEMEEGKVVNLKYREAKKQYPSWVKKGRETLLTLNNLTAAGKIRLDMLTESSFWEQNLKFGRQNGQIDLQDIFTPSKT